MIFSLTFPPGVLDAYVAQVLLLLKTLPIESHVQGLDNVTHIATLLTLAPILQEELLCGFFPSWLNLIFMHDFGWHSFTTELLDYLQLESRSTFAGADYLKFTHQKKNWWWPRLHMCLEGCTDKTELKFAKKAWKNLRNKQDDYFYTGLYFCESLEFHRRMSHNDPLRFLYLFPAMHTFMLARLSPVPCERGTNKAACFGLEAIMAIWMSNKLPGMSYEEGHCYNDAYCGCRFWGKGAVKKSLTYVSFEKVDGDFLPIMGHSDLHHIRRTYDKNNTSFTSSMIVNTPFIPHLRVKKILLKAFSLYKDEGEIKLLFQQAEERAGEDISHKLRKEVDLKNGSPGFFVSKNGKFAEQGASDFKAEKCIHDQARS